ncbi:MAG: ribosomal protein S18-alanine N-acetyltransferase [Mobilitalea sp.]
MVIRKMTEADLPQICAIEQETFSMPWKEEDFRSSMIKTNNGYIVAEVDSQVIGYCGYWGILEEGDICNVAVIKEYRNQKVAYHMLVELMKEAKEKGITAFTLEVRIGNHPAIHLYEALGFKSVGLRKKFYSKPEEDAVIMWLK